MSQPQTKIPSPARSLGTVTPRRLRPRGTRSTDSPARASTSRRLSAVTQFKENNRESFVLSPAPSRRSVLNDDTNIEEPKRRSWWKKLSDNSRDVMEVFEDNRVSEIEAAPAVEEFYDIEVLSQEKKDTKAEGPLSSDNESIHSIDIPQRKLFSQKDLQVNNKLSQIIGTKSQANLHNTIVADKTIEVAPKNLFGQNRPRSKPIFPAALLNISLNKTANKTREIAAPEEKVQVRSLFGNRGGTKRKNIFADFVLSESEDEISEIQPKVFGFQKQIEQRRDSSNSRGKREHSPTSSITTDIEMDEWQHLPSSTMCDNQIEDMMAAVRTPVKRARLSNLTDIKELKTRSDAEKEKSSEEEQELTYDDDDNALSGDQTLNNESVNKFKKPLNTPDSQHQNEDQIQIKDTEIEMAVASEESIGDSQFKSDQIVKNTTDNEMQVSTEVVAQDINKSESRSDLLNMKNKTLNQSRLEEESETKIIQDKLPEEIRDNFDFGIEINTNQEIRNRDISEKILVLNNREISAAISQTHNDDENEKTVQDSIEYAKSQVNRNGADKEKNMNEHEDIVDEKDNDVDKIECDGLTKIENEHIHHVHNVTGDNLAKKKLQNHEQIEQELGDRRDDQDIQNKSTDLNKEQSKSHNETKLRRENDIEFDVLSKTNEQAVNNSQVVQDNVGDPNDKREDVENSIEEPVVLQEVDNDEKVERQNKNKEDTHEENIDENLVESEVNEQETEGNKYESEEGEQEENEIESEDDEQQESKVETEDGKQEENEENIVESEVEKEENDEDIEESQEDSDIEAPNDSEIEVADDSQMEVANDSETEAQDDKEESEHNESIAEKQNESEMEDEREEPEEESFAEPPNESLLEDANEGNDNNEDEAHNSNEEEIEMESQDNEESEEENNESHAEAEDSDEEQEEESEELQYESETEEEAQNESNVDVQEESENEIEESNDQDEVHANSDPETPNVSHDTTGRNRQKNDSNVNSPEVIRHDKINQIESFTAKGHNTSLRKTTMLKNLSIRPSMVPPRESTGLSDGTRDSSAEGSGWDSHRTTRKTLRQTFGKDFTPRKSLRTLVMEKSAKRQTEINDASWMSTKLPQANSTEVQDTSLLPDNKTAAEPTHEVSIRTRQTTLEMYLQKIKKQNLERKLKMEEAVRNSLKAPSRDNLNPFKVPSKPMFSLRKPSAKQAQNKTKGKPAKSTLIPLDDLPQEVIEDMKYKPPKRFQPSNAAWITKRLYKFLESKLESKYDYKARIRAEKLVETIYRFAKDLRRHNVAPKDAVDLLKHEMARLDVVKTHFEFYQFFHDYMPREIRVKVVPDIVNKINMPRHGVFSDILRGNTVQG